MNLYIGNLNYNVREGDLRGVMEEYGTVASVKLITDRETRRSKGFAFVGTFIKYYKISQLIHTQSIAN